MRIANARAALLALSLGWGCGFVSAQPDRQPAPAAQPGAGTMNREVQRDDRVTDAERDFIQQAAERGMHELKAAQLAATQASDPQVRSYASMLANHHTHANQQLFALADARRVGLPPAPPRRLRIETEHLGKKTGADFDREFVRQIGVEGHEKSIKLYEKAAKDTRDPQLKAFVERTLPLLRDHLAQAERLPQSGRSGTAMGSR